MRILYENSVPYGLQLEIKEIQTDAESEHCVKTQLWIRPDQEFLGGSNQKIFSYSNFFFYVDVRLFDNKKWPTS
jgi:hypothetical protein